MRKAIFGGITLLLVASQAVAGDKVWSVPGVVNNGLATIFACTNGGTVAASVTVDLFTINGVAAIGGSATVNLNPMATGTIASKAVVSLSPTATMATGTILSGSARITAASGVYCVAYVTDPVTDPPTVMMRLPVIKKTSQKGD